MILNDIRYYISGAFPSDGSHENMISVEMIIICRMIFEVLLGTLDLFLKT